MAKPKDKSALPWSIKGVSREARDMARQAAAEQGKTMGEWVTDAIRATRDVSSSTGQPMADQGALVPSEESLRQVQDQIAARVAESEERLIAVLGPLSEVVQTMADRIENLERKDRG